MFPHGLRHRYGQGYSGTEYRAVKLPKYLLRNGSQIDRHIKTGGIQILPAVIEAHLCSHLP